MGSLSHHDPMIVQVFHSYLHRYLYNSIKSTRIFYSTYLDINLYVYLSFINTNYKHTWDLGCVISSFNLYVGVFRSHGGTPK